MYVVIVGCGRIGVNLVKALTAMGQEVTAIDENSETCRKVADELGSVIIQGNGSSLQIMKDAGVARAELVVAVTGTDETNLAVCQLAKAAFQTPRTIALVKYPNHVALFQLLGVDTVVNTTHLIISNIEEAVPSKPLVHLLALQRDNIDIVSITIPADAAVIGKSLSTIDLPPNSLIVLVVRNSGPLPAQQNLALEANDEIIVATVTDEEQSLYEALTGVSQ